MGKPEKIPYAIAEFIRERFREDFLFTCRSVIARNGQKYFEAEISKDDITHQLWFDETGKIMKEDFAPDYPSDQHESLPDGQMYHEDHLG